MRVTSWVFPAYLAATAAILIALFAGNLAAAQVLASLPFAIILVAMLVTPRREARPVLAGAGVFASALTAASFGSSAGDWAATFGFLGGTILLTFAVLAAGGWQAISRNRVGRALYLIAAGFLASYAIFGIAVTLPGALRPMPVGCVDTCWGDSIGLLLAVMMLGEVLLATLFVAAIAKNRQTGLGALVMAVGQNILFFSLPPRWSLGFALGVPMWLAGLLILTAPWTHALPWHLRRSVAPNEMAALK